MKEERAYTNTFQEINKDGIVFISSWGEKFILDLTHAQNTTKTRINK